MKKSVLTIPLLLTACILTIFFGTRYAASQREEMSEDQFPTEESGNESEEIETESTEVPVETANSLEDYQTRMDSLSIYEKMDYLSLLDEGISVAFYGNIDLTEDWIDSIVSNIESHTTYNTELLDFTHPDVDSYDLYIQQTAQPVINESPDIIFYGLPALADKTRDIGLAETESYMSSILNSFSSLEGTDLIFLEPYPIIQEIDEFNSRSLDYRSYLNRMTQLLENTDSTVLTLHSSFTESAQERGLQSYYNETDYTLNAEGHQLAAEIIDNQLNETAQ